MNAQKFLETYARAWETRDAELVLTLFTEQATYQEDPFDEPIRRRDGIRAYWEGATSQQKDIRVSWGEHVVAGNTLIAEWRACYTHIQSGERRELRGILLAEFEGERVRRFREYWHRRVL